MIIYFYRSTSDSNRFLTDWKVFYFCRFCYSLLNDGGGLPDRSQGDYDGLLFYKWSSWGHNSTLFGRRCKFIFKINQMHKQMLKLFCNNKCREEDSIRHCLTSFLLVSIFLLVHSALRYQRPITPLFLQTFKKPSNWKSTIIMLNIYS